MCKKHTSIVSMQPPSAAVVHCFVVCWNIEIDNTSLGGMIVDQSYDKILFGVWFAA